MFLLLLPFWSGCVSPNAVRAKLGALEAQIEQKADTKIVAEQVEHLHTQIEQTTQVAEKLVEWKKSIQAETINYGGAGWVVVGTSIIVIIFLGAGFLLIKTIIKRSVLLKLLTQTIYNSEEHVQSAIKKQIKHEVSNGGEFKPQDKEELKRFTKKMGTFIENKA